MNNKICAGVIAALLATSVSLPAAAQYRPNGPDRHGPHANGPQGRAPQGHGPQRNAWREVGVSHGHKWRKGQKLARNQRRYVVSDWNRRGLRTPPRGYQWVRENNNSGDYLLVAAATGLIASILTQ